MRIAHVLLLLSIAVAARAQTFEQLGFLRLNDTTPKSTRSAAMGSATDALAGEVTDASSNPATLASIHRTSFEVQSARNSITYNQFYETPDGLPALRSTWRSGAAVSQIAVAVPVRRLVVGAYYAREPELTGLEPFVRYSSGSSYVSNCPEPCQYALPGASAAFLRNERRYGAAVGWEHGAVAIGVGAELRHIDERSDVPRTIFTQTYTDQRNEMVLRRIDDRAVVANAGLRWRVNPRIAVSAAYNGGGSFTRATSACNIEGFQWSVCSTQPALIGKSRVQMPDVYRAGISIDATKGLRLIAEGVRRNYSSLARDSYSIFGSELIAPYRDVAELHAGAEYRVSAVPLVLRAGWWRDPSRYASQFVAPGQTVHHYTGGIGFHVGSARVDLAYDDSHVALQRRAMVSVGFDL